MLNIRLAPRYISFKHTHTFILKEICTYKNYSFRLLLRDANEVLFVFTTTRSKSIICIYIGILLISNEEGKYTYILYLVCSVCRLA